VRHYPGGIAEWKALGLPIAPGPARRGVPAPRRPAPSAVSGPWDRFLSAVTAPSVGRVLLLWLWMVIGFGLAYWLLGAAGGRSLASAGGAVAPDPGGLATSLYFSFVTALSIGYGDVAPLGVARVLAVAEGAAGLILFGVVISRLVSRRQEELTEEIHRITFAERLDRVQTNLHDVLSDMQSLGGLCGDPAVDPERLRVRLDSMSMLFATELRSIHDLLYRPQQMPGEHELEAILAQLAACFEELDYLLGCSSGKIALSPAMRNNLRAVSVLAEGICGDCVPREYAPDLRRWMDRIQELARRTR
jgi:hypothetical protein